MKNNNFKVGIVGLGYVGLPLAIEFGKKFNSLGYDISKEKVDNFRRKLDPSKNVNKNEFYLSKKLFFTNEPKLLAKCKYIIICIPTPIKINHKPDLRMLKNATIAVAKNLKKKSIIIYESTVYPGCTEDFCVPIIEKYSLLKWKKDFNVGYSPERINPGDKVHNVKNITKIVSADSNIAAGQIFNLYSYIIKKLHIVSSIKIAEAAKIIENTQRDLNIALMNEFSIICKKLNIDTQEVISAAATKWNFIKFIPGLVGGHCIGVDPYYLAYKANILKYKSRVILSGRFLNESMDNYVYNLINSSLCIKNKKILFIGITFKENCSDIRNSKNLELLKLLLKRNITITVCDYMANLQELDNFLKNKLINIKSIKKKEKFDIVVLAVPHYNYLKISAKKYQNFLKNNGLFVDLKGVFNKKVFRNKKINYLTM
jgi:UDP-N-acetyl-D-glucosamine/UDP-N-acetyl-D-galactosamine dehydrogenase